MPSFVGFYEQIWTDAAREIGAAVVPIDVGIWRITRGAQSTIVHNYVVQIDDPVTLNLAGDKVLCHRLLLEQGLPVPEHEVYTVDQLDRAHRFIARFPGACFVVKPAAGTSGARGVTTHIVTPGECRDASVLASLYDDRLLIERWIPGESYRLLFLDGQMIHATRRRGRRVQGDGRSTIRQLIGGERLSVQAERDLTRTLEVQRLGLSSVPDAHQGVLVQSAMQPARGTAEVRTVFDEDVTAAIGPELREQGARAVRALGSAFAGVDIITCNPAVALHESGGVINEINTTPGLHHHYRLAGNSAGRGPAVAVLERLLHDSRESRGLSPEPLVSTAH